jgi:hypothetical protein
MPIFNQRTIYIRIKEVLITGKAPLFTQRREPFLFNQIKIKLRFPLDRGFSATFTAVISRA